MERELARLELHHGPGFGDHGSRVALLSVAVAHHLGLKSHEINRLRFAALVHDVGKIEVDTAILEKPTALTAHEEELLRQHPKVGADRLGDVAHPTVIEAVLCHHERWDGAGFPLGLRRTEIPLYARVIFVADAYDVMTTGRSYRPQMTMEQAGAELVRMANRQFDPKVVDAFAFLDRRLLAAPIVDHGAYLGE